MVMGLYLAFYMADGQFDIVVDAASHHKKEAEESGRVRGVYVSHVAWGSVDSCLFVMVVPQSRWYTPPTEKSLGFSSPKIFL